MQDNDKKLASDRRRDSEGPDDTKSKTPDELDPAGPIIKLSEHELIAQPHAQTGTKLYCFTGGTLVKTPEGDMPIDLLIRGTRVLTFDENAGEVSEASVQSLRVHDIDWPVVDVATGRDRLTVVIGHRFATSNGWLPVEQLENECVDISGSLQECTLREGAPRDFSGRVYNITLENNNDSYFVGSTGVRVRDH